MQFVCHFACFHPRFVSCFLVILQSRDEMLWRRRRSTSSSDPNKHANASFSCSTSTVALQKLQKPRGTTITTIPSLLGTSASAFCNVEVNSPMNSNSAAVLGCRDIFCTIFERLPVSDLARAACVCRLWNSVASDREIQTKAFILPWKLKDIIGIPSSRSFWHDNCLGRFAISHRLVRGDTVASLAIKYSVQVMDIKRLNNMMSDHGIYSRERLLIPLSKPELLHNQICYIELDEYAKREVAVLCLEGDPD